MKELTIRPAVAIGLCILFGGAFTLTVIAIMNGMIVNFDKSVIAMVQGLEAPWLTSFMQAFDFIGSTKVVILLTIIGTILVWKFSDRSRSYFFLLTMSGTILLYRFLKDLFKRDRPEIYRLGEAGGYSFPSGHAMMAFSLYGLAIYLLWRHVHSTAGRFVLVTFSIFMFVMIAMSRIYLGVHYPSDILGAVIASAFWITLASFLFTQIRKRKRRSLVSN